MDKNAREKETFYRMTLDGIENVKESFTQIDHESKSYFTVKEDKDYLMEYAFDSLPQLKEKLSLLWKDEECMKGVIQTVLVAAMKNKPSREVKRQQNIENHENTEGDLPAFIYNF